jgi:hypothetical protein
MNRLPEAWSGAGRLDAAAIGTAAWLRAWPRCETIAQMLPDQDQLARWLPIVAKQAIAGFDPERALNNWERFFRAFSIDDFLERYRHFPRLPATFSNALRWQPVPH